MYHSSFHQVHFDGEAFKYQKFTKSLQFLFCSETSKLVTYYSKVKPQTDCVLTLLLYKGKKTVHNLAQQL